MILPINAYTNVSKQNNLNSCNKKRKSPVFGVNTRYVEKAVTGEIDPKKLEKIIFEAKSSFGIEVTPEMLQFRWPNLEAAKEQGLLIHDIIIPYPDGPNSYLTQKVVCKKLINDGVPSDIKFAEYNYLTTECHDIDVIEKTPSEHYHDQKTFLFDKTETLEDSNGKTFWIRKRYDTNNQSLKMLEIGPGKPFWPYESESDVYEFKNGNSAGSHYQRTENCLSF